MGKGLLVCLVAVLTGCSSGKLIRPITPEVAARGMVVVRELPDPLPSETARVPDSQYVMVFTESTVVALLDMASPVPLLKEAIEGAYNNHEAAQYKARYAPIDPYTIAHDRLQGSPLITGRHDAVHMMPLVYMVEGDDGRFRPTLVFRVESRQWLGRYMYHLPTSYTKAEMQLTAPEMIGTLRQELSGGADVLRGLMERDARGELRGDGLSYAYGSYYLVGGRVGGLVPASIVQFKDCELIEEGQNHLVLRSQGDLKAPGPNGALAYGVHYFRRDQLHTFKRR